ECLALNEEVVHKLPGHQKIYTSIDKAICENGENPSQYPEKYLYSLTPNGLLPQKLSLKSGSVIILLRNLDVNHGLCNGARLIVRRMQDHVLDCELMTGELQKKR
ncbi:5632_t:CDS:1, partial [Gigaspora rosea]